MLYYRKVGRFLVRVGVWRPLIVLAEREIRYLKCCCWCVLSMYCQGGNVTTGDRVIQRGDKVFEVLFVGLY